MIGYGNPLREDDGAGWYVADRVADRIGGAVEVLRRQQLTPELSADLAEVDLAFFVDARADSPERGVEISAIQPADGPSRSHYCSPESLLAAAAALFGHAPRAYLVSLPAFSFGYSESLTPGARGAAEEAAATIVQMVEAAR